LNALGSKYCFVVSGHSHQRMVRKLGTTTFINAGTLFREHQPCVLVLDVGAMTATFHEWDGTSFAREDERPLPR
jgi:predicted phosphodiesterase